MATPQQFVAATICALGKLSSRNKLSPAIFCFTVSWHSCLHQAALEAKSSGYAPWQWQKYALGYQTRALETFRPALTKITSDNCHAAFGFSVLTKLIALSLLGNTLRDPRESILEMREYVQGIGLIYRQAEEELKSGPFGEIFADLLGEDLSVFWATSSPRDHDGYA
ncbi:hypothetical protein D6D02_08711 [Aureobasidium pullulans]|nr:hypothetical protein D6D23_09435 [Aureobasidium pullulans]THY01089.1 hypothetical protein D6D02_08711 [Aureobasidium pullulans]